MRKTNRASWLSWPSCNVLAAVLAPLLATPALAQAGAGEGEIIVTAQKREQNLQDVPVSVSVLSAGAL
ncbi:MAG TPA: hypothetical protein VN222_12005, partial [Novosphingobium sp.]|nr:hypothetical protein [Novosphingobium sp.]